LRALAPSQLYSFKKPPVLGGEYVLNNFEPISIEVHFSLLGRVHEQVRKLPPDIKIAGVQLKMNLQADSALLTDAFCLLHYAFGAARRER